MNELILPLREGRGSGMLDEKRSSGRSTFAPAMNDELLKAVKLSDDIYYGMK